MVTLAALPNWIDGAGLLAQAAKNSEKLPPPTRAAAQMALIGIGLVGLLFVVMILLGGHWVRRQGIPRRGPIVPPDRAPLRTDLPKRHDEHEDGDLPRRHDGHDGMKKA